MSSLYLVCIEHWTSPNSPGAMRNCDLWVPFMAAGGQLNRGASSQKPLFFMPRFFKLGGMGFLSRFKVQLGIHWSEVSHS